MDIIDEIAYNLYGLINSYYNPFERIAQRRTYIDSIADNLGDFLFGDSTKSKRANKSDRYYDDSMRFDKNIGDSLFTPLN